MNNLEDDGKMELNIRKIKEDDYQKIFVLTDIHGRFDLFEKLIGKIDLKKKIYYWFLEIVVIEGNFLLSYIIGIKIWFIEDIILFT